MRPFICDWESEQRKTTFLIQVSLTLLEPSCETLVGQNGAKPQSSDFWNQQMHTTNGDKAQMLKDTVQSLGLDAEVLSAVPREGA